MSGNQRSPYDARRSPTTLHYRSSYSSDGQHPRPNQYDPTTPVHAHSPVAYNANNHPSTSTRLPPPSTNSTGTFYDPTQVERTDSNSNWGGYSGYSRHSSQSQQSPSVRNVAVARYLIFLRLGIFCADDSGSNLTATARVQYRVGVSNLDPVLAFPYTLLSLLPEFQVAWNRELSWTQNHHTTSRYRPARSMYVVY